MRKSTLFSTLLVPILLIGISAQAFAQFTTPDWSNANLDNGSGDNNCFDTGELYFNSFNANALLSINDPGSAYGHGDGTYELEVRSGGDWISIHSVDVSDGEDHPLTSISLPINFASRNIDGFRLRGVPPDDCTFHNFNNNLTFTFATSAAPIPSLSNASRLTLVLIFMVTGLYLGRRRFVA